MSQRLACLGVLVVFFGLAWTEVYAQAAELLNDIQNPMVIPNNFPSMSSFEHGETDVPCHIEYQVTRRKIGRCVKLGQGINGCVSGQYLNPFHPDCV